MKHLENTNLAEEALCSMLNNEGEELEKSTRRMQKFNSALVEVICAFQEVETSWSANSVREPMCYMVCITSYE